MKHSLFYGLIILSGLSLIGCKEVESKEEPLKTYSFGSYAQSISDIDASTIQNEGQLINNNYYSYQNDKYALIDVKADLSGTGLYSNGKINSSYNEQTKAFKFESLTWTELEVKEEKGKSYTYLLSDRTINSIKFSNMETLYAPDLSDLCRFLNEDFMINAFSEEQIDLFSLDSWGNKITLPTYSQVKSYKDNNLKIASDLAIANGLTSVNLNNGGEVYLNSPYWTSTTSLYNIIAMSPSLGINDKGYDPFNESIGARPVIKIETEKLNNLK